MTKKQDIPDWLLKFIQSACETFELGMLSHIGWSVLFGVEGWEAWMYPTPVEILGGRDDGEEVLPSHRAVNISDITVLFDEPPDVDWCHCPDHITEVSIDGRVKGHGLWLHIQEEPPKDMKPTVRFDVNTGTFEDLDPGDEEEAA